jgi:hypothetical protein
MEQDHEAWPDPPYESDYVTALVGSVRRLPHALPNEVAEPLRTILTDSGLDGRGAEAKISRLAEDLADTDETLLDLWDSAQQASPDQNRGWETAEVVIAASTLGPFVTAFCTELGRRFGGTVADWAGRVRLSRRRHDPAAADLIIDADNVVTVLELEEELSDEARLALLDLDIKADAVRGHRLAWNTETQAWMASDIQG